MPRFRGFIPVLVLFVATLPLLAATAQGSFDRSLKVTGPVDLEVKTGSGNITVRNGAAGTVTIHGIIRASESWLSGGKSPEEKVQALENNPPIEQSGNTIRIGNIDDDSLRNNVSISYELVVPAETRLGSHTGSGGQTVEGIKGPVSASSGSGSLKVMDVDSDVSAHTGSGDIDLDGIEGMVEARAGSGTIHANHLGGLMTASKGKSSTAASSVQVRTGSGEVRLENVSGRLFAETGSSSIEAGGDPEGSWELHTGSGGITVRLPTNAAFDIKARTGSGSIKVDHPVTVQGEISKHELRGSVRGGGFGLDLHTGSGSIRVQ